LKLTDPRQQGSARLAWSEGCIFCADDEVSSSVCIKGIHSAGLIGIESIKQVEIGPLERWVKPEL